MTTVVVHGTSRPATRLRLTVRGRRVLAAVIALPLAAALGIGAIGSGAALAARDAVSAPSPYGTVTVAAGDTLWTIAERADPRDDPRDVVDTIVRVNALPSVAIIPGQQLAVPLPGRADR